ncbi:MAG TPA: hypothetical protein PK957_01905 [Candidatus Dojkabacteria bacterium]|nr:hypothetical protein [Candidatus Dojkabacteria bacterium]HQF36877.1 hypothetical protein [Candidatus Dojkabacteria bacterium]
MQVVGKKCPNSEDLDIVNATILRSIKDGNYPSVKAELDKLPDASILERRVTGYLGDVLSQYLGLFLYPSEQDFNPLNPKYFSKLDIFITVLPLLFEIDYNVRLANNYFSFCNYDSLKLIWKDQFTQLLDLFESEGDDIQVCIPYIHRMLVVCQRLGLLTDEQSKRLGAFSFNYDSSSANFYTDFWADDTACTRLSNDVVDLYRKGQWMYISRFLDFMFLYYGVEDINIAREMTDRVIETLSVLVYEDFTNLLSTGKIGEAKDLFQRAFLNCMLTREVYERMLNELDEISQIN